MESVFEDSRFLLFADYTFYPNGGWEDFRGAYATIEDAHHALTSLQAERYNWYQIVNDRPHGLAALL
jgi:hypothetical protein